MSTSTSKETLIDAYNVMFAHPTIGPQIRQDLSKAREQFLVLANLNRPQDQSKTMVVFDAHRDPAPQTHVGRQQYEYVRGVYVVFASETADVWIQKRIRAHSTPSELTIVTSDREILNTAEAYGCSVLRTSVYLKLRQRSKLKRLSSESEKPQYMSRKKLHEWEELFRKGKPEDDDVI